ncbi:MAG TPA: hypothetical protein VF116_21820 [Ktedonobacterales bacterium]
MGFELIRLGAGALRHILGVLLLAWRRVVRTAGIALVAGVVVTEIVGSLVTHHFPPYPLTHVVALAIGIVVAYCVALMVLVDELLRGAFDLVRMALGEAEAGTRAAAIIAEREVGDVWGWARRLAAGRDAGPAASVSRPRLAAPQLTSSRTPQAVTPGASRASARTLGQFPTSRTATGAPASATTSSPAAPARLRVPPRLGATHPPAPTSTQGPRDETRDDIAATDVFRKTAPPTPAHAHPVRADQLPRIEWAAEGLAAGAALLESVLAARARHAHQESSADHAAQTVETPLEAMPPLPRRSPAAGPASSANPAASDTPPLAAAQSDPPATAASSTVPLTQLTVEPRAASPTIPRAPDLGPDLQIESAVSPRPFPRPSSPVRTVPVITDATTAAALETAVEESVAQGTADATSAPSSNDAGDETPKDTIAEAPDAPWEPPNRVVVLPAAEGRTPRASQGTGKNAGVWPDEDEDDDAPRAAEERGLWSRIGQALVRSTTRPLRERSDGDGDGESSGDAPSDRHA